MIHATNLAQMPEARGESVWAYLEFPRNNADGPESFRRRRDRTAPLVNMDKNQFKLNHIHIILTGIVLYHIYPCWCMIQVKSGHKNGASEGI